METFDKISPGRTCKIKKTNGGYVMNHKTNSELVGDLDLLKLLKKKEKSAVRHGRKLIKTVLK